MKRPVKFQEGGTARSAGQRPTEDRARMAAEAGAGFDAEERALEERRAARAAAEANQPDSFLRRVLRGRWSDRPRPGAPAPAPARAARPAAPPPNQLPDMAPPPYEETTPEMRDLLNRRVAEQRPRPRPAPARQREMTPEERHAFMVRTMQEEADREAAARQPERGFFERLGLRRTNETGMEPGTIEHRRNYLGSGATDTNVSMNKKGGMIKAYREGGPIRQGMQSPKAQEGRAEMAEDVMRRERAREPISDKERRAGRMEERMTPGVSEDFLRMRERERAGFKKGGAIKPKGHGMKEEGMEMKGGRYRGGMQEEMAEMMPGKKGAMPMMKKGGKVKAPAKKMKAGGKVAPKKMMKGGMTSKPKKMMGGGKVKYAKGGMTKGCK